MRGPSIILILLAAITPSLRADEVKLSDGGILTGKVMAIAADGKIAVDLPIAEHPLQLRADHVRRVEFSGTNQERFEHDARLTLINGDTLPCDIISIDEQMLSVFTSFAGPLEVPRNVVTTAQLGIRPHQLVYQGPENLEDWKVEENWHYQDGTLTSDGRGSISRSFDELPESFSFRFDVSWVARPNLQVYFCSDTTNSGGGKINRYYLQMGSAGIEIKRQSSTGKTPYQTIALISRMPESFKNRHVNIEIRVDHRRRMLMLFLDGELEGRFQDPLPDPPVGKTIVFQSNVSNSEGHRISKIKLHQWDPTSERHKSEDRGDSKTDSLIDNEGQRFAGSLVATQGEGEELVVLFKNPHNPDALAIPMTSISTVFFSTSAAPAQAQPPLLLSLSDSGSLGAEVCTFSADEVELTHSLLGPMRIKRSTVKTLERREIPTEEEPETETEE